ncbi:MAG: HAMP domain-containing sensor histidine kinase [Ruminococcus sp.]|jgi:signal transduction histidine kinase
MKNALYLKFTIAYLILGFLSFFVISFLGSTLIQKKLTQQTGDALYREAVNIASNHAENYYSQQASLADTYRNFCTLAEYQNAQIWMLDTSGNILINTAETLDPDNPEHVDNFDPADLTSGYYTIGTFYHQFSEEHISVMVPITLNMSTKGYIALHMPLSNILSNRDDILNGVYVVFIIIFAFTLLILLVFNMVVYSPLKQITQGANEYASGNLKYNIPVHSDDEIGYLAMTLNYMSDELDRAGEFQRQFVSNVSHDFRSPLTSIKGYIEAILDGTIPPEMQSRYLNIVLMETERLNKLTQSLLTLDGFDVRGYMLDITDFDINNVIRDTAATFGGTCLKRKITIQLKMTSEPLMVSADMGKIQQVLYNLIDNAIKFSSSNSTITVETTERHGKIFVSVKDSGTGIPKDSLPKIWDRFYKLDTSRGKDRKGTGLGLSIVKEIINAHNQNINVISTEGVGSEFIFTLSRAKKGSTAR